MAGKIGGTGQRPGADLAPAHSGAGYARPALRRRPTSLTDAFTGALVAGLVALGLTLARRRS